MGLGWCMQLWAPYTPNLLARDPAPLTPSCCFSNAACDIAKRVLRDALWVQLPT